MPDARETKNASTRAGTSGGFDVRRKVAVRMGLDGGRESAA